MTSAELADEIARRLGIDPAEAANVLDSMTRVIQDTLIQGKTVRLTNLGQFALQRVHARIVIVPGQKNATGVREHVRPDFKLSANLVELVRESFPIGPPISAQQLRLAWIKAGHTPTDLQPPIVTAQEAAAAAAAAQAAADAAAAAAQAAAQPPTPPTPEPPPTPAPTPEQPPPPPPAPETPQEPSSTAPAPPPPPTPPNAPPAPPPQAPDPAITEAATAFPGINPAYLPQLIATPGYAAALARVNLQHSLSRYRQAELAGKSTAPRTPAEIALTGSVPAVTFPFTSNGNPPFFFVSELWTWAHT